MSIDAPQISENLESPDRRGFLKSLFKFAAFSAALKAGVTIPEAEAGGAAEYIRKKYGIEVFFTEQDSTVENGDSRHAVPPANTPAAFERRFFAEDMIARFLDKYPPRTLRDFVKRIQITGKIIRSGNSKTCIYTLELGGVAHSDTQTVEISSMGATLKELIFDHEVAHLVLRDVTRAEWVAAIKAELGAHSEDFALDGIGDAARTAEESSCQYDPRRWREKGYSSVNFAEDIARTSERVFHPSEYRPVEGKEKILINAKIHAFKKLFAARLQLPYNPADPGHPNNYWNFIRTLPHAISMEYFFSNGLLHR